MFTWSHLEGFPSGPPVVLRWDLREVARLCSRLDGSWYAVLDQHLDHELRRRVDCTSYERGRAGVDTWAQRHQPRIAREIEAWRLANPPHRAAMHLRPATPPAP